MTIFAAILVILSLLWLALVGLASAMDPLGRSPLRLFPLRVGCAAAVLVFAVLLGSGAVVRAEPLPLAGAAIEVAFAPGDGPPRLAAAAIGEAKTTVRVMTYQLSSGRVINALIAAAARGVDVEVIVDGTTCATARLQPVFVRLDAAKVATFCDGVERIHHHKVVVVDAATLVTGSFNFSAAAERNAENLIVIRGAPRLVSRYLDDYAHHRAHATRRGG